MVKTLAMVSGIFFVLFGFLGFFPNPVVGLGGFFETNTFHNFINIILGACLVVGSRGINPSSTLKLVAVMYLLLGILGFIMGNGKLFGLVHLNVADNWLHLVLALGLFIISVSGENQESAKEI